jgi:hypothetical protein
VKSIVPAAALLALAAIGAWLGWQYHERRWLESPIEGLVAPILFEVPRWRRRGTSSAPAAGSGSRIERASRGG